MIQFRYLASLISEDGYCTIDTWNSIEMVKKVFMETNKLFTDKTNLGLNVLSICSIDMDVDSDTKSED